MAISFYLPGETVNEHLTKLRSGTIIKTSNGLKSSNGTLSVTKPGVLRDSKALWIENNQKTYIPVRNDVVIGVIVSKNASSYNLDINSTRKGILSTLGFEGASKRYKPNLEIGDSVYCRIESENKFTDPILSCKSLSSKKEWSTREAMFSELYGGCLFSCSLQLTRALVDNNKNFILEILGKKFPYEIRIGLNGMIWINSESNKKCIIIKNCILLSEKIKDRSKIEEMVHVLGERA